MKKLLSILLASIMLVSALTICANATDSDVPKDTVAVEDGEQTQTSEDDQIKAFKEFIIELDARYGINITADMVYVIYWKMLSNGTWIVEYGDGLPRTCDCIYEKIGNYIYDCPSRTGEAFIFTGKSLYGLKKAYNSGVIDDEVLDEIAKGISELKKVGESEPASTAPVTDSTETQPTETTATDPTETEPPTMGGDDVDGVAIFKQFIVRLDASYGVNITADKVYVHYWKMLSHGVELVKYADELPRTDDCIYEQIGDYIYDCPSRWSEAFIFTGTELYSIKEAYISGVINDETLDEIAKSISDLKKVSETTAPVTIATYTTESQPTETIATDPTQPTSTSVVAGPTAAFKDFIVKRFSSLGYIITEENVHVNCFKTLYDGTSLVKYEVDGELRTSDCIYEQIGEYTYNCPSRWNEAFVFTGTELYSIKNAYESGVIDDEVMEEITQLIPENFRITGSQLVLDAKKLTLKAGEKKQIELSDYHETSIKGWSSSNKKVAKVVAAKSADGYRFAGKVVGLKKGTAVITVTLADGKKLSCKVNVTTSPKLNVKAKAIKKGKSFTLKVSGKAATPTFKSGNTKIAKVSKKGVVKGKKKGVTYIYVKVNGVSLKCKIRVK